MKDLPFLKATKGTKLLLSPFCRDGYFTEVGMIENGFLEGWGMRFDLRMGEDIEEGGSFHLGNLHGIGFRADNEEGKTDIGFFLNGEYIPDIEAFGQDTEKDGVYVREEGDGFPFPVILTVKGDKRVYAFDEKEGFQVVHEDGYVSLAYLSIPGLDASKEQIDYLCSVPGADATFYFDSPKDIPDSGDELGMELKPRYDVSKGEMVQAEGSIKYLRGRYRGELDSDNKPHGYGRFEYGDDPSVGHNKQYEIYEGEWVHGAYHGFGVYVFLDSRSNGKYRHRYIGQWKDGKKSGYGYQYNQSVEKINNNYGDAYELYRGTFENGERQGAGMLLKKTPQNGESLLSSDDFIEGRVKGKAEIRYENGDCWFGDYNGFYTEGYGVYSLKDHDAFFRAEWTSSGPKPETIEIHGGGSGPFLMITRHRFGWATNNYFVALLPAEEGEIGVSEMAVFRNDAGIKQLVFKILSVEDDQVTYVVDKDYSENKESTTATIHVGEENKHGYSDHHTARIYDDEYDYSEGCELIVKCF